LVSRYAGKRVTVMGLGLFGGGAGAARFFAQEGARVTVTDAKGAEGLEPSLKALAGLPLELHLGGHEERDFREADLIVANPAVKPESPYLQAARDAGAEVKTEVSVFAELCPARMVGVTGSNGKSTTTALAGAMIKSSGIRTWVGGNIGGSLLERLDEMGRDDVAVVELSSFQLPYLGEIGKSPHVGVLTNLSPNHLDRHGTMEAYAEAKSHIFRHQEEGDFAVLGWSLGGRDWWSGLTAGKVLGFGLSRGNGDGAWLEGGELWLGRGGEGKSFARVDDVGLVGEHNLENVLAGACAAWVVGADPGRFAEALRGFKPLEHRLELVRSLNGVDYYNDSIATTPESAIAGLRSFPGRRIVLIAGGYDKGLEFSALAKEVAERAAAVIMLGATAEKLEATIAGASPPTTLEVKRARDLAEAVNRAREMAGEGAVVLLSPACASYDMFRNFAERGNAFRETVLALQ